MRLPYSHATASRFQGEAITAAQCFWDGGSLHDAAVVLRDGVWRMEENIGLSPQDPNSGTRSSTAFASEAEARAEMARTMTMLDRHLVVEGYAVAFRGPSGVRWSDFSGGSATAPIATIDENDARSVLESLREEKSSGTISSFGLFGAIVRMAPDEGGNAPSGWQRIGCDGDLVDLVSIVGDPSRRSIEGTGWGHRWHTCSRIVGPTQPVRPLPVEHLLQDVAQPMAPAR